MAHLFFSNLLTARDLSLHMMYTAVGKLFKSHLRLRILNTVAFYQMYQRALHKARNLQMIRLTHNYCQTLRNQNFQLKSEARKNALI